MTFKDHFSTASGDYARHRPRYPAALFDWLATCAPSRAHALDVATGNGQAAVALAACFERVTAIDASAAQIAAAEAPADIFYEVAPAEAIPLPDGSVDLLTVAQALHWLDLDRFYPEARRVLKPRGVIAAWTYNLLAIDPAVDRLVNHLYGEVLGPWWPAERRLVENGYADLPFPFARIPAPGFAMSAEWSCAQLLGYLRTWSACRACIAAGQPDPVTAAAPALHQAFGAGTRTVQWPLAILAGRGDAYP